MGYDVLYDPKYEVEVCLRGRTGGCRSLLQCLHRLTRNKKNKHFLTAKVGSQHEKSRKAKKQLSVKMIEVPPHPQSRNLEHHPHSHRDNHRLWPFTSPPSDLVCLALCGYLPVA
ncbi:hypothetical protein Fmac_005695 [Flemingia macrophylla]|uniref:Uncharacterized protein n=1 Tax=Flemingia macrophylla TaxID=520843 RepID=A0ABD1N8K6_9FABA